MSDGMKYYLFALKFLTPVHFGHVAEGGKLEQVSLGFSADQLFSTLVNEAISMGYDADGLIQRFASGEMRLSSMFPWYGDTERELYLPKPFVQGSVRPPKAKSFEELKQAATELKKMKKMTVVRASEMRKFVSSIQRGEKCSLQRRDFAAESIAVRVNKRESLPKPYYVGSYTFAPDAGLYFLVGLAKEEQLDDLQQVVNMLGLTGIGGKRSSGYGKFELADEVKELSDYKTADAVSLASMLKDESANIQMNVAPVCPEPGQEQLVAEGYYKLRKISGFVDLPMQGNAMKKDSFYVLADGSCFSGRVRGQMKVMHIPGVNHPVYRDCQGMFVGVKTDE